MIDVFRVLYFCLTKFVLNIHKLFFSDLAIFIQFSIIEVNTINKGNLKLILFNEGYNRGTMHMAFTSFPVMVFSMGEVLVWCCPQGSMHQTCSSLEPIRSEMLMAEIGRAWPVVIWGCFD